MTISVSEKSSADRAADPSFKMYKMGTTGIWRRTSMSSNGPPPVLVQSAQMDQQFVSFEPFIGSRHPPYVAKTVEVSETLDGWEDADPGEDNMEFASGFHPSFPNVSSPNSRTRQRPLEVSGCEIGDESASLDPDVIDFSEIPPADLEFDELDQLGKKPNTTESKSPDATVAHMVTLGGEVPSPGVPVNDSDGIGEFSSIQAVTVNPPSSQYVDKTADFDDQMEHIFQVVVSDSLSKCSLIRTVSNPPSAQTGLGPLESVSLEPLETCQTESCSGVEIVPATARPSASKPGENYTSAETVDSPEPVERLDFGEVSEFDGPRQETSETDGADGYGNVVIKNEPVSPPPVDEFAPPSSEEKSVVKRAREYVAKVAAVADGGNEWSYTRKTMGKAKISNKFEPIFCCDLCKKHHKGPHSRFYAGEDRGMSERVAEFLFPQEKDRKFLMFKCEVCSVRFKHLQS